MITLDKALEIVFRDLQSGNFTAAEALARQITGQRPDAADGWVLLGRALVALDRPADGAACLEKALELGADDPTLLAEIAALPAAVRRAPALCAAALRSRQAGFPQPAAASAGLALLTDRLNALPGGLRESVQRRIAACLDPYYPPVGVNLGGGAGWFFPFFVNYDAGDGDRGRLDGQTRLPMADAGLDYVFTSHFLEHVDDETAAHLLREARRMLRPGGVLRITVPDAGEALRRYRAGDAAWFDRQWVEPESSARWTAVGIEPNLESKLLFAVALHGRRAPSGAFLLVPPPADREEVRRRAMAGDDDAFGAWAVSLTPPEQPGLIKHEHINWFTWEKLSRLLRETGFATVERSACGQSKAPLLRDPAFDNRPEITLYVEAWR
jgi:SAM-dependent methyltransferase